MTAPALIFLAPPSSGEDHDDSSTHTAIPASEWPTSTTHPAGHLGNRHGRSGEALRMTRGAREAAIGMKVADADIQRCLDAPNDVAPDPHTPSRPRFRRGKLVAMAAADGTVLRVNRRR